jgi:hypothetical protein
MKKFYPYIWTIISLFFVTIIWEKIKIPYDQTNLIQGEFFFKKYNPINEIFRVLIFILIPIFTFLISYLICFKNQVYKINPYSNDFFLKKDENSINNNKSIKKISYVFLFCITLDFFITDFNLYVSEMDVFHEGTPLVPPLNHLFNGTLWLSTLYDYGLVGNNLGLLISKFTNNYSIGSVRFFNLLLLFFNEILLVFICRKLISSLNFDKYVKDIFFILFTLAVIGFINYNNNTFVISFFPPRSFLFLLFILITTEMLINNNNSYWKIFLVGNFSLLSILWWIDIGIYINLIITILLIYLITQKEYLKVFYLLFGIFCAWLIFIIYFPIEEVKEFFYQIKFITNISGYLLGLEYPQPFSSHSSRETRALLLIIFAGIFVVILSFNKKLNLNFSSKIIISIFFVSSIIFFQSSIMRTDAPHIKYSSGSYMFILYFSILFFLFYKSQNTKIIIIFKKISSNFILISLICFFSILNVKILNLTNIPNIKNNISGLIHAEDKKFLSDRYRVFLKYYSKVSKNDNCVQVLSDDIALPYLLNKPSCTQFFIPAHILSGWSEDKFITQIKESNSQFILYSSPISMLNNKDNMPNVRTFIMKNYYLYENFDGWKVYKKK